MTSVLVYGTLVLVVLIFLLLQRLTEKRQIRLSADQFSLWFQKAYLGMSAFGKPIVPVAEQRKSAKGRSKSATRNPR